MHQPEMYGTVRANLSAIIAAGQLVMMIVATFSSAAKL